MLKSRGILAFDVMRLIKVKNYREMSKKAAKMIINDIRRNLNLTIGFATGKTILGLYKELVNVYKKKKIDFSKAKAFALDEYYPIKKTDKNSYYFYMFSNLFNKVNIKRENINLLDGETKEPEKECKKYEAKIKKNPIDLQILGVGVNGHIGFNEPYSSFDSKTRLVELSQGTINSNSRFFKNKDDIPKKALTEGISTIIKAKKIIILASGKEKAEAIYNFVKGRVSRKWPITLLKNHKNLIVIIDKNAASLL